MARVFKRFTRTIICDFDDLDARVADLVKGTDDVIVDLKHFGSVLSGDREGLQRFVLLCEDLHGTQIQTRASEFTQEEVKPKAVKLEEKNTGVIPKTKSPLVEGFIRDGKNLTPVYVMAGLFSVVEGGKLHSDDKQAAPFVLMSPEADLSVYPSILNTGGSHAG